MRAMSRPTHDFGLHFRAALLPRGWAHDVRLEVVDGRLAGVAEGVAPQAGDERAALGLPGLSNLHSHAFQRGMAGLAEFRGPTTDTFWTWRELMYRFLAHMTPDDVEAISAQAYVEMLEAGFTRVGEFHYLHHDPSGAPYDDPAELSACVVSAAEHTGIALTLLPVFYAHGGFGGAPPTDGQRRFVLDLDRYAQLVERSRALVETLTHGNVGLAPHSLRAVTPDELSAIVSLAGDGPIHIHAAEQVREVEDCVGWSGQRPVEWLLEAQPVDRRWCLVHATHMSAGETARLAQSGAVAGLCPITEANLGDGTSSAVELRAAGGLLGIGTDSNVRIDASEELRQLEYSQRLRLRARNVLAESAQSSGRALYEAALAGGARALGARAGLEVGAPADLISLKLDHPSFAGRSGDQLLDSWIFAGARGCIDAVWRAGSKVVSNGRHRDREAIAARYQRALEGLLRA
jgi:formiminoglutamate deiminase